MAQSAYPTAQDLEAWLTSAGFAESVLTTLDAQTAVGAGIAAFESAVGRRMLAESGTRTFEVPTGTNPVIDFREDLASQSAFSVSGTAYVAGTDFLLLPQNAASRGLPYWGARLARTWTGYGTRTSPLWNAVSITGSWGYATTIPDDAWLGMLTAAALHLHTYLAQAVSLGLISVKEQDAQEEYGVNPYGALKTNWSMALADVVKRYRRVTVGIGG